MATQFETKASAFLEEYWRLNPVEATNAGVYRYNNLLPDWSEAGQAERESWRKRYKEIFSQPGIAASAAEELDRKVALAELAYFEIEEEWQWLHKAPAFYVEEAMNGINYLLSRPDPASSQAEKNEQFLSRLSRVPTLL